MVRVTYTHICDQCKVQVEHEKVDYLEGVALPLPSRTYRHLGMTLCEACHDKALFALREAFAC